MSIISTRKSAVHPATTRRPGRPFGEGILDSTPTAGATARKATLAPGKPAAPSLDSIPDSVRRIRVISGAASGVWTRWYAAGIEVSGMSWQMEGDGSDRRLHPDNANHLYRCGRVEILAHDPARVEQPPVAGATPPRPFHPTPAECAWLLAFELAAAGDDAAAPAGSPADVVAAWEEGTLHGGREFDARMDLASERSLLLDRMCGQDIPHGEWMEARIVPPVTSC
jgi:hypothetical protein